MLAKVINGVVVKYPYSFTDLQSDYPNVSFPASLTNAMLAPFNAVIVVVTGKPAYNVLTHKVEEPATPVFSYDRNQWEQSWNIVPLTSNDVPESITAVQGLLALDAAGYSAAFDAWSKDPARTFAEKTLIFRETIWKRDNELLKSGATAMGITPDQLNALFRLAKTFPSS